MNKPNSDAFRVATIIMGDDEYIFTSYGKKTLNGLADLIHREMQIEKLYDFITVASEMKSSDSVAFNALILHAIVQLEQLKTK